MVTNAKLYFLASSIHMRWCPTPVITVWNEFSAYKDKWFVYDFSDGIATIVVYSFNSLETLGELIKGCFEKKSNFKKVLFQTFDVSPDTPFIGIRFVHNGTIVLITHYNKDDFIAAYQAACRFPKSENYRTIKTLPWIYWGDLGLSKKEFVKKTYRSYIVQNKIHQISENTDLLFKDPEAKALWQHWEQLLDYPENAGLYASAIPFAKRFAKWIQYLYGRCDKPFHYIADIAINSGNMDCIDFATFARAVTILTQSWKFGDELGSWFVNKYQQHF